MIDISSKTETLRSAVATSSIKAKAATIQRAWQGDTPKGDVLTVARVAGILAAKKTPELIPYCHDLLLDQVKIDFTAEENAIIVRAEAKTIGRTGIEMEVLLAAMIAALTIYDMLKGIDPEVVIGETKLLEKHGGKSDFKQNFPKPLRAAILVSSDSVASGKKTDRSGEIIREQMQRFPVEIKDYQIVPDETKQIQQVVLKWVEAGIQLILITGGTGLSPRDITVEAIKEIVDREIPGIAEAMRSYGQRRTPYAMLSRGIVGTCGPALVITLPGSTRGVQESIDAIFPNVLHVFKIMKDGKHGD